MLATAMIHTPLLLLLALLGSPATVTALDNNAALTPPLGFNPWNGFKMNFNSSLIEDTVEAMAKNGLLDAGWNYMTLGGSTYAHEASKCTRNIQFFNQAPEPY